MINLFKSIIFILNFLLIGSFITYTILFYFQNKINFLSNFIVIIAITTFFLKLIYWYLIRRTSEMIISGKKSNVFLLRLSFCIFTYITPTYYILQRPNLVMSEYVISVTLIIISILVLIGMMMERYLFYIESNYVVNNLK